MLEDEGRPCDPCILLGPVDAAWFKHHLEFARAGTRRETTGRDGCSGGARIFVILQRIEGKRKKEREEIERGWFAKVPFLTHHSFLLLDPLSSETFICISLC